MNPTWQNSRWLPSSCWVRMNEWCFCANGGNQSLQLWVSLRENSRMAESKISKFKMVEFKMAAIIKLSENEWVRVRLYSFERESDWSESIFEWIWEKITRCLNPTWKNSRWLPSSSWMRMNKWSFFCAKYLNPRWQNWRWLPSSS